MAPTVAPSSTTGTDGADREVVALRVRGRFRLARGLRVDLDDAIHDVDNPKDRQVRAGVDASLIVAVDE